MNNPSFEGRPIIITEAHYQELVAKEARLAQILAANPELDKVQKVTPALKKVKTAFAAFLGRVEHVLSTPEFFGVFQVAAIHGCAYKGDSLAKDIADAKALLGTK